MEAMRLIGATRHALAGASGVRDIVTEAWQVQALAQAMGSHLAITGPVEIRAEACGLSEAGGRACGSLRQSVLRDGGVRATQLSEMRDPRRALLGLGGLLGDVGIALVTVASASDEDGVYWQCIEAIDAADESSDRVLGLLRRFAVRERGPDDVWARRACGG
ncbi:DUF6099 family protein [Streptomyces sp. NPDC057654]|uniref:DUF6099 family protein n=1 Tax=Streptomyces sp. NPDC057654 TaxID=3346196 RepID=UPI0036B8AF05